MRKCEVSFDRLFGIFLTAHIKAFSCAEPIYRSAGKEKYAFAAKSPFLQKRRLFVTERERAYRKQSLLGTL